MISSRSSGSRGEHRLRRRAIAAAAGRDEPIHGGDSPAAPCARSQSATARLPFNSATAYGVRPSARRRAKSAPRSTSSSASATSQRRAATCSGVSPLAANTGSGSAPCSSSHRTPTGVVATNGGSRRAALSRRWPTADSRPRRALAELERRHVARARRDRQRHAVVRIGAGLEQQRGERQRVRRRRPRPRAPGGRTP